MRSLGLDLGGTYVKWAMLEDERLVASGQAPTNARRGPTAVVDTLAMVGRSALATAGSADAVGVGVPGLFDAVAGTARFLPNLPGDWDGEPVTAPLAAALALPVTLVNDARAFALAEWRLGAARGATDAAFVVVGTGVGGGLVVDGKLHLGHDGTAGELGHQTVDPDGPLCGCGNGGCVEAYACAAAIAAAAGVDSVPAAAAAAKAGNSAAAAAFERAGRALGIGLANVVLTLAPERIVVGGGVGECGELLLGPIRAELERRVRLKPPLTPVVAAELGPIAGAVGAAVRAALTHTV